MSEDPIFLLPGRESRITSYIDGTGIQRLGIVFKCININKRIIGNNIINKAQKGRKKWESLKGLYLSSFMA